jgi:hypothetical protein
MAIGPAAGAAEAFEAIYGRSESESLESPNTESSGDGVTSTTESSGDGLTTGSVVNTTA